MISSIDIIFLSTTIKTRIFSFVNATNHHKLNKKKQISPGEKVSDFAFAFLLDWSLYTAALYSFSNSLFAFQLFATSIFSGIDSIPQKSPIETKPYLWHSQPLLCSLFTTGKREKPQEEYTSQSRRSLPRRDPLSRALPLWGINSSMIRRFTKFQGLFEINLPASLTEIRLPPTLMRVEWFLEWFLAKYFAWIRVRYDTSTMKVRDCAPRC